MRQVRFLLAVCALSLLNICPTPAPTSDATPPKITLRHWNKSESGGQGSQTTIESGGKTTVEGGWLGPNKADITVDGSDKEGIRLLEVSGTATGVCAASGEGGTVWTAPELLHASFPKQTQVTEQGKVRDFLYLKLDKLINDPSCGTHQYNGMKNPAEFSMSGGTWTITARAENCCGGEANATFTLEVK